VSNIHKAFILGAGLGTRLKPLTDSLPKPLVPLYHEPMVNYALRHCQSAGITSFAINTHHIPEQWQTHYPDNTFNGAEIEFFFEQILLETGGGIKNIASYIGSDPLLIYNGDILTDLDIEALMQAHLESGNVATLALFPTGPNCNVAVENDKIVDMRNDRGIHPGTHQFTGIYCINPEILELIPANEKISIVPAFLKLAEQGKIGAFVSLALMQSLVRMLNCTTPLSGQMQISQQILSSQVASSDPQRQVPTQMLISNSPQKHFIILTIK